jgi:hypothetical protein
MNPGGKKNQDYHQFIAFVGPEDQPCCTDQSDGNDKGQGEHVQIMNEFHGNYFVRMR